MLRLAIPIALATLALSSCYRAHGYTYHYYPEHGAYYSPHHGTYYWYEDGAWATGARHPHGALGHHEVVHFDIDHPRHHYARHHGHH